jgi:hypothetical protein
MPLTVDRVMELKVIIALLGKANCPVSFDMNSLKLATSNTQSTFMDARMVVLSSCRITTFASTITSLSSVIIIVVSEISK